MQATLDESVDNVIEDMSPVTQRIYKIIAWNNPKKSGSVQD